MHKLMHILGLKVRAVLFKDLKAVHDIGAWYASGDIRPLIGSGLKKGFKYYKRAAIKGHPESQYDLGFIYWVGELGEIDKKNAFYWFRKAAEQGYKPAMELLHDIETEDEELLSEGQGTVGDTPGSG